MKTNVKKAANALGIRLSVKAKKMPVVDTDGRFKTKNKKHDTKVTKKRDMEIFEMSRLFIECE